MHSHILTQGSLVEAHPPVAVSVFFALSSFQLLCSSDPLCKYVSIHAITSCITCNHLFPIISPSFSFAIGSSLHGCFASVCHPAVTLCASAAACAFLFSGSRMGRSLSSSEMSLCSSSVDILPRQAIPFSVPISHFRSEPHSQPYPQQTLTVIYAYHRSKHALLVSLLCRSILHFLFYYL